MIGEVDTSIIPVFVTFDDEMAEIVAEQLTHVIMARAMMSAGLMEEEF